MYNYPYGDNQQINLNWIISEIIALHQRLDPDYTAPTFTQIYPFSDTQQLNLDWILTELKALKDLAPTPPEEIDEIGQALIAGAYDATTSYQKNDYIVQDEKVYRANAATTGTFDPTKWNEVLLGDDMAIITRWADATNAYLNSLAASNVANDSSVTGTTVKAALNYLLNTIKYYLFLGSGDDAPVIENGTDYNTITAVGAYRVLTRANASTMINTPNTFYTHRLIVMCLINSSTFIQIFICNYSTNPAIFIRVKDSEGNWSPWRLTPPIRNSVITVTAGTGTQTFTWNICSPDMIISNVYYSNPKAVGSNVTFTTGNGTISISGTFYEPTDIHFDAQ